MYTRLRFEHRRTQGNSTCSAVPLNAPPLKNDHHPTARNVAIVTRGFPSLRYKTSATMTNARPRKTLDGTAHFRPPTA